MKADSTIRKQMRALRQIVEHPTTPEPVKNEAYLYETALLWVLKRCDWSLVGICQTRIPKQPLG